MSSVEIWEAAESLPAPSAEIVLLRVFAEAFLTVMPRRKAERFLRVVSEIMATEESVSLVLPIRPASQSGEIRRARREAMSLYKQLLPTFVARLPTR